MTAPPASQTNQATGRSRAPVFVLGSPRSGTTLLYDILLSAGGFAVYLAESNVFNLLAPRFGDLSVRANRHRLFQAWLGSKLYRASGIDKEQIRRRVLEDCRNPGDFLRTVMEEICAQQGMSRWAENSPEAILYLPLIKRLIPDALVLHIIRDGRDVATSLGRLRYVRPLPWEDQYSVIGCGLYWEWVVQHGRRFGRLLGNDYMEVRFEELLSHPQQTLDQIARFIAQPLDYATIQRVGYGSVSQPNTSFSGQESGQPFNPVGRWKNNFSPQELLLFERLVGTTLAELGYSLATDAARIPEDFSLRATRQLHRTFFESKFLFKNNRWVRLVRPALTGAEIDKIVLADDHPPLVKAN